MYIKSIITRLFYNLPIGLGLLCCTHIPLIGSSHSQDMQSLVEKITKTLRAAVDAANISVKLDTTSIYMRPNNEEETKELSSLKRQRERRNTEKLHNYNLCMRSLEATEKLLKSRDISGNYQNIINTTGIDGVGGFIASGEVSSYLRDVQYSGFVKLADHLKSWRNRFSFPDRVIQEDDIDSKVRTDVSADLMSCVLFWEQIQHSTLPCFKEVLELFENLGILQARLSIITAEEMNLPERISHHSGLETSSDGWWRWLTDKAGSTKPQEKQDKRICNRSFCNEFFGKTEETLALVKTLKENILKIKTPGFDFYQRALSDFIELEDDLTGLRSELNAQLQRPHHDNDLPMGAVKSILQSSMDKLRGIDKNLRHATRGWSNNKNKLTGDQQRDLDAACDHDDLLFGSLSSMYNAFAKLGEVIQKALPSKDLDLYSQSLAKHLKEFENARGKQFVWPRNPPDPHQSGDTFLLSLFSANHAKDCIEWLGSIGFPPAIDYIRNASGVIDETVTKIEQLRVSLAQELRNVQGVKCRFMPIKSLDEVSKGKWFTGSMMAGDYDNRCAQYLEEYQAQLPQYSSVNPPSGDWLKKSIRWYRNINKAYDQDTRLAQLLDAAESYPHEYENISRLYFYINIKNDHKGTLLKDLTEYRKELKKYEIIRLINESGNYRVGLERSMSNRSFVTDAWLWLKSIEKEAQNRNKELPPRFLTTWAGNWQLYKLDNPEHTHVLPALFSAIVSAHCNANLLKINRYSEKYVQSKEQTKEIENTLFRYSFLKRVCAPFARWCGFKWGTDICRIKERLKDSIVATNELYRKTSRTFNSYTKYNNLYHVTKLVKSQNNLPNEKPNIDLNSPVIKHYFKLPSVSLNNS